MTLVVAPTSPLFDRASVGLTIGSSDRECRLWWAKEGVDDWDKSASFDLDATSRRSTSSLDDKLAWRRYREFNANGSGQSDL
jgi:hypothetical protein